MEKNRIIDRINTVPFGLKISGLINIIFSAYSIVLISPFFILGVIFDYGEHGLFCGFWDWFFYHVASRLVIALLYFSLLLLFYSSIDIFNNNSRAKKLIIISSPIIIMSMPLLTVFELMQRALCLKVLSKGTLLGYYGLFSIATIVYPLILLVYIFFNHSAISFFNNKGTKLNLGIPLFALLILYLLGFVIGWSIN